MNIRQIPNRLEITFWSALISIMSELPQLGVVLRPAIEVVQDFGDVRFCNRAFIWSAAGLLLGFLLGLLEALLA